MMGTAAVGTAESGVGGAAVGVTISTAVTAALVYDIVRAIGKAIADAIPDTANPDGPDNNMIVVRGGIGELPAPGTVFSGAIGATLLDAASGVPHNQISYTNLRAIREGGGAVVYAPEPAYPGGPINPRHVNITLGNVNPFVGPIPNPVPKDQRIPGRP
jgi:hypothetical protein